MKVSLMRLKTVCVVLYPWAICWPALKENLFLLDLYFLCSDNPSLSSLRLKVPLPPYSLIKLLVVLVLQVLEWLSLAMVNDNQSQADVAVSVCPGCMKSWVPSCAWNTYL